MRAWRNLGVVETIYEEEYEYSSSSPSLSPTLSSPSTPLHSRVEAWSMATGRKKDASILVKGTCFHLHKDPLTSRSTYLKRHLNEVHELTLSPPLNITVETFALVANFCYGSNVVITPFNVAALRTAAELLQMTETNGEGDENLKQITENYFRQLIAVNGEFALIVFRACLALLPEAETAAFLLSRSLEALSLTDDSDGDGDGDRFVSYFDDVIKMRAEEFQIVAESMKQLKSHDVVYRVVDYYIKEHSGKITEDQKTQLCNSIDCSKLSPELLLHAVQNPRLPLRFIVRAMLIEQLNTRRAIFSTTTNSQSRRHRTRDSVTLGAILQREAATRQAAQLKASMDATSSRIQSLERELQGMKKLLIESEKERNDINKSRSVLGSGRSASFHHVPQNRIERGERGSSSSLSLRFSGKERAVLVSSSSEESCNETPRTKKNIGMRFISGLKNAFKVSNSASKYG